MDKTARKVRTPFLHPYGEIQALMRVLPGCRKSAVAQLSRLLKDQAGTPQNPVDWSNPDEWIGERLKGDHAILARQVWEGTQGVVNPRHMHGTYLFINMHSLMATDAAGIYEITEIGQKFLDQDPKIMWELDDVEGILKLLDILATKDKAKRGDLLPEWSEFLKEHSTFATKSTFSDTLRRRLAVLVERGLVSREGVTYAITQAGLEYIKGRGPEEDPRREVMQRVNKYNAQQREMLRKALGELSPYQFEHVIGALMEAMGYEDVTVTKQSGDKGVDVVATVQLGITTVREVVQAKRYTKGNLGRQVIDQLRGVLPFHQAIRGTLITLGGISKGATEAALFPGAAPITLIDGDRLLDLLIEHEIGIRKRAVEFFELDTDALSADETAESEENEDEPL